MDPPANVRERLSTHQVTLSGRGVPPSPDVALPVITFSTDLTFHINDDQLNVIHLATAHTDGDAIIHFTRANVIHAGDLYFNGLYPYIDVRAGGSIDGMIAGADSILVLCNESTKIIPGHGPLSNPNELRAYRDMLATVRDRVHRLIAEGAEEHSNYAKTKPSKSSKRCPNRPPRPFG